MTNILPLAKKMVSKVIRLPLFSDYGYHFLVFSGWHLKGRTVDSLFHTSLYSRSYPSAEGFSLMSKCTLSESKEVCVK